MKMNYFEKNVVRAEDKQGHIYVQLSFFPETIEEKLTREMKEMQQRFEKNRKSLHAKKLPDC